MIKNEMVAAGEALLYSGACWGWQAWKEGGRHPPPAITRGQSTHTPNPPFTHTEPEKPVMSRSGDECVVALTDQW